MYELKDQNTELRAKNKRLREALEPFAEVLVGLQQEPHSLASQFPVPGIGLTYGDFVEAKHALTNTRKDS